MYPVAVREYLKTMRELTDGHSMRVEHISRGYMVTCESTRIKRVARFDTRRHSTVLNTVVLFVDGRGTEEDMSDEFFSRVWADPNYFYER